MFNKAIFLLLTALLLSSCGTPKYATMTPDLRMQFDDNLKAGVLNLTCDEMSCDFSWIENDRKMARLFNSERWQELAETVMQIGFPKDLAYYYLGRAAEGQGYNDAALIYYQQCLNVYSDQRPLHHVRENFGFGSNWALDIMIPKRMSMIYRNKQLQAQEKANAEISQKRNTDSINSEKIVNLRDNNARNTFQEDQTTEQPHSTQKAQNVIAKKVSEQDGKDKLYKTEKKENQATLEKTKNENNPVIEKPDLESKDSAHAENVKKESNELKSQPDNKQLERQIQRAKDQNNPAQLKQYAKNAPNKEIAEIAWNDYVKLFKPVTTKSFNGANSVKIYNEPDVLSEVVKEEGVGRTYILGKKEYDFYSVEYDFDKKGYIFKGFVE
jgi:hypothetical protein